MSPMNDVVMACVGLALIGVLMTVALTFYAQPWPKPKLKPTKPLKEKDWLEEVRRLEAVQRVLVNENIQLRLELERAKRPYR